MFNLTKTTLVLGAAIISLSIAVGAQADTTEVVEKNGEFYQVVKKSDQVFKSAKCENLAGTIMTQEIDDVSSITVVVGIVKGDQKIGVRLFDVAADHLTVKHNLGLLEFGCLTEKGGLGIYIPHEESASDSLSVQIDYDGRVFVGYDQVGLSLYRNVKPDKT